MRNQYFEGERFENISLSEEVIEGYEFVDCRFLNCSFEKCKVLQCSLSECRFESCSMTEISGQYSDARFLELDKCALVGIDWSAWKSSGRFGTAISRITDCKIKYNTFTEMAFPKFDFSGSMFAKANLSGSSFRGCDLADTEFFQCDLRKSDFRQASGYKVDVLSCQVKGAKFSYPEAINLLHYLGISVE